MAMRELVTGGAACSLPGSSSSANPLSALADTLIGSSPKTQEKLKEIPTSTSTVFNNQLNSDGNGHFTTLPGSESDYLQNQHSNGQGLAFLDSFHAASSGGLADAWDEIHHQQNTRYQYDGQDQANITEAGHIYNRGTPGPTQLSLEGPPQKILSSFLHSFVRSSSGGLPFQPTALPVLGLTKGDKQCIRDRSSIMARHFFSDKNEDFINAQVHALLCSLDIDTNIQAMQLLPGRFREMEGYWSESQPTFPPVPAADQWLNEFEQNRVEHVDPDAWATSFERQHGPGGWASQFELEQAQLTSVNQKSTVHFSNLAAMEQSRRLANTLAQNDDPKFQNSRFLQFVSKMSRGELFMEDNQVHSSTASGDWATEYSKQYNEGLLGADQYEHRELSYGPGTWVNEFATESEKHGSIDDEWVDEFSKLNVQDWAEEFGNQAGDGVLGEDSTDTWAAAYDEYMKQVASKQHSESLKGVYVFSDMNPYVGHPDPLREGQELFRKGLLSEAVLALEAEVLKNPENAEGWRLLGIAHAENDDDQQAIASMMKAQEVDPTNLEVLLALGVSHTNELEQAAALKYLYQWLRHHPNYGALAPKQLSDSPYHADVARIFNEAAQTSPEDADVHIVLGVLYNLSREYDKAIESFKKALKLKPHDYSLWNKLGATQANSVQSADAILAYQQALDLKPNYVRAWANMGISYANQGMYEESIRYYVRALSMNPKADNAWQYLKISLSCTSRNDMLEACDSRNLDVLQKAFPL
ncbi:Peroxisomal membrane signal receptor PTS1 [Ancistrocladus abbreviatus]